VNEHEIKLASFRRAELCRNRSKWDIRRFSDGDEEFGAVREVSANGRPEPVIYVENTGEFVVPLSAVEAIHSQKVILNCAWLERRFDGRSVTHTVPKSLTLNRLANHLVL
jgi:hypothetical protein